MQKIHANLALTSKGWVRDLCIEIEDSRIAQVSNELPKEHYSVDLPVSYTHLTLPTILLV